MTADAFSYSWASIQAYHKKWTKVGTLLLIKPLRSPMSIFSKSPDLEKCEAGKQV